MTSLVRAARSPTTVTPIGNLTEFVNNLDESTFEAWQQAWSPNTRRAYATTARLWIAWTVDHDTDRANPTPADVANWTTALATGWQATGDGTGWVPRKASTVARHRAALASILGAHHPAIASDLGDRAWKGERRRIAGRVADGTVAPLKQAPAAVLDVVKELVHAIRTDPTYTDTARTRDVALILIGFGAGRRRSELANLRVEHVTIDPKGLVIWIPMSKTDQYGTGFRVAIPKARVRALCPVVAWQAWLKTIGVSEGPAWRHVDRHGHLRTQGLSGNAIWQIMRRAQLAAGVDPLSPHSLRSGVVTELHNRGATDAQIMAVTGHRDPRSVATYRRRALDPFDGAISLMD
jgi:integrase